MDVWRVFHHKINVGLRFQTRLTPARLWWRNSICAEQTCLRTSSLSLFHSFTMYVSPLTSEVELLGPSCDTAFTYFRSVRASVAAISPFHSCSILVPFLFHPLLVCSDTTYAVTPLRPLSPLMSCPRRATCTCTRTSSHRAIASIVQSCHPTNTTSSRPS